MYRVFFIFVILFFCIMLQLLLGNLGLFIPLYAPAVFYFAVVYGWRIGAICGCIAGIAIALLYGGNPALEALSAITVAVIAVFWLHRSDTHNLPVHFIPGAIIGAVIFLPHMFYAMQYSTGHSQLILAEIMEMIFSAVFSALLLPVVIYILDWQSKLVGLPLYVEAKKQLITQKR